MSTGRRRWILPAEEVVSRSFDEETVILDLERGVYFGLDAVGTRVWQLIEQGTTIGEILGVLGDEYDVEPERAQADLERLLEDLQRQQLVVVAGEPRASG